jgi:protein subunit release factor A
LEELENASPQQLIKWAIEAMKKAQDLEITVARASGPGGQGVNTTDSAVQILHKPTGLIVTCADERSQIKNKARAMTVLRSRLLQRKQDEEHAKYSAARRNQIGSGDRSERIRTYHFLQNRVTDHRIGLTLYSLPQIMEGEIDEIISALQGADYQAKLAAATPRRGRPKAESPKLSTTIRLDADVLEAFRATGPGWQSRINEALRLAVKKGAA